MKRQLGLGYLAVRALLARRIGSSPKAGAAPDEAVAATHPNVLVVSPYSIHPLIHGGAARIFNLVRRLSEHADVSVFIFGGGTDDPPQRAALEPFCRRIFFQRYPRSGAGVGCSKKLPQPSHPGRPARRIGERWRRR